MSIEHVEVDDTIWPVDIGTDEEESAQWILRYGDCERREQQRMSVASVLAAYAHLTDPDLSLKSATEALRRARAAKDKVIEGLR